MKWLFCFFSLFILFSCNENTINEADMFKGKLNDKEYKAIELSVTHFNNYLKKCYPNLSYNESYQQFVQDFVKDEVKKGFYTIAYEDKINNNLLKNNLLSSINLFNTNALKFPLKPEVSSIFNTFGGEKNLKFIKL